MTDLLPQLALGSAETMRRFLERPQTTALSPLERRDLVRHSLYVLRLMQDAWAAGQRLLANGVEATAFESVCEHMTTALDHYLGGLSLAQKVIGEPPRSERRARQLARLSKAEEERSVSAAPSAIGSTLSRRPPRPIDWNAVAEVEAAHRAANIGPSINS